TLTISNTVTLGGSGTSGALTNFGTVVWPGSTLYGYNSSAIHNAGVWQAVADNNNLSSQSGTNIFVNAGLFQKTQGNGSTIIGWPFSTTGTTEVRSGTLSLSDRCVQTAGVTMLDGGNLSVSQPLQLLGGVLAGTNTITGTVT